ncbi:MAG: hypothetical protein KF762_05755 [Acidobacteria bacterium]|nr:hypothetical protein [Acidobacteriota bacterium]
MLARTVVFVALFIFFVANCIAQSALSSDEREAQRRVQKIMLVNDLENRVREVALAAPRVLARYRAAEWLWSDKEDDIERAEDFAVAAIEDLYKNRVEVPSPYFSTLSSQLFALLDRYSPETSQRLKAKHKVDEYQEDSIQYHLLNQPGGEKAAVDATIRALYSISATDTNLPVILLRLKQRNSPELFRLLDTLIAVEERNPGRLELNTLVLVSPYYDDVNIQSGSAARFGRIVLRRTQIASQLPFADFDAWLDLLNRNSSLITRRLSDRVPEVEVLRAVLASRISQKSRAERERNERIRNSIDPLGALIEEAENVDDPIVKYELYQRAVGLALDQGLFRKAADLALDLGKVDLSTVSILANVQKAIVGQLLERIAETALKVGDDVSAIYAVERQMEDERKAEGELSIANYYVENQRLDRAREVSINAQKTIAKIESLPRRASFYIKLIPISQKIDPTGVYEVNALAARSINMIPTLNVEDKPETENFKKHVAGLMIVNWNLLPMLVNYVKSDNNGASDFVGRIEKKEVKLVAELLISIQNFDRGAEPETPSSPPSTEDETN